MRSFTPIGLLLLASLACSASRSQAEMVLSTVALSAGGGVSSSASLAALAVAGQPIAGYASSGSLSIHAGFVPCIEADGVSNVSDGEHPPLTRLRGVAPNPFHSRTSIGFDIARSNHTTVRIYDVAGRLIRTLLDSRLEPGTFSAEWDGVGPDGVRVGAGIYYCQIHSGGVRETQKLTIIR